MGSAMLVRVFSFWPTSKMYLPAQIHDVLITFLDLILNFYKFI
jgi:hypothetical protein